MILVFVVWVAVVLALTTLAVAVADRFKLPRALRHMGDGAGAAADGSIAAVGRVVTASLVLSAGWSVVIIVGWVLGSLAHRLQTPIDEPTFHWWRDRHLGGEWHDVWWKLTDIGSTRVIQVLVIVAAVGLAVLYRKHPYWWAPSVIVVAGYLAEYFSQIILKQVVDRGHPPTALGTWPSGGMARLIDVYGLILFFVIGKFWPRIPRVWALGAGLLALCASIQAYARINNLEHWLTDVIGGSVYGLMLLGLMVSTYAVLTRQTVRVAPSVEPELQGAG